MSIPVKIISGTESGTIKKGNFAFGISKDRTYGPTSETGFYKGHNIPEDGYVIYLDRGEPSPSAYICVQDSDLISLVNNLSNGSYIDLKEAIEWINTQEGAVVFNNIRYIDTNSIFLNLNASNIISYSGTSSNWYDNAENNNGSLSNGIIFDERGWLNFDGVDDVVLLPTSNTLTGDNIQNITISAMIKYTNTTNSGYIFAIKRSDTDSTLITITTNQNTSGNFSSGFLGFLVRNQANTQHNYLTINNGYNDGKWHYIVARVNNELRSLFIDGQFLLENSGGIQLVTGNTALATIGSFGNSFYFSGSISDINLYRRGLTNQEILHNYYQAPIVTDGLIFSVDAGNLVSYEPESTDLYNLSGTQSGTLINGVGYSKSNGGSWIFDSLDDYISMDVSPIQITTGDISICCWIKINSYADPITSEVILRKNGQSNNFYDIVFRISEANKITYACRKSTGNILGKEVTEILDTNKWYHISACGVNDDIDIYINGVLKSTTNRNNGTTSGESFYIGGTNTSSYLDGQISNIKIYNKSLTQEEITQNFNTQRQRFGI